MARKTNRIILAVLTAALLVTTIVTGALARTATVSATLTYSDIRIEMDGNTVDPKDVNGNSTEPFAINGTTYVPLRALCEAMGWTVKWDDATKTAVIDTGAPAKKGGLLAVVDCVEGTPITDSSYDRYFKGTAEEGVKSILAAGQFFVNGTAIPAREGSFALNGKDVLWQEAGKDGWTYSVHIYFSNTGFPPEFSKEPNVPFEQARLWMAEGLSQFRGSVMELYDVDADGYADKITTIYYDSALVADIKVEGDTACLYGTDGKQVAQPFPAAAIQAQGIAAGDVVMFWYDGGQAAWQVERATAHTGILVENPADDHHPFWIETGTTAKLDTNDCLANKSGLPEFSRNTQFIRGFRRTGGYDCAQPIIMWTTPNGHYAFAYTRADSSFEFLKTAIETCEAGIKKANVTVSKAGDGSDVPVSQNWVTQEIMTAYETKLAAAKEMLSAKKATGLEMDAMIFDLGNAYGGTEGGMNPKGLVGSMQPGKLLPDGTVKAVCDGSATYKAAPEDRDYKMGWDGKSFFTPYFGENVKDGIQALVAAGGVTVNDLPADMDRVTQALKSSGTNITLTVKGGAVTKMELFSTAGVLVDTVKTNADGSVTVTGGGRDITAPAANVAAGVKPYTVCVYWEGADGMHIMPADTLTGTLVKSDDHAGVIIRIDGKDITFAGADMYQRGASAGNRPGGYANTTDRLELKEHELTAWLIPGTKDTDNPMIIAFTTGTPEKASARLQSAIDYAQALVDMTVIAESAQEAATKTTLKEYHWLKPGDIAVLDGLKQAIADAKAVLADQSATSQEVDDTAYDIQIAVWGSNSDVSAVFMGNAKDGYFDKVDGGIHALPAAILF